ncbi:amidohydrolase [Fusarium pseudoanthophilum]|uniref:Amidohydrolase n=1 Tax=Fusarium pseudoanthophilum TaxID=48495 RepID=A0A8H5L020_9HYPO|nr:amidohydrolase [Fusarium pseudoanthophilum]
MDYLVTHLSPGSLPLVNHIGLSQIEILGHGSLTLGHEEYEALGHYQNGFCLVHTSKAAAWSFPVLLLQKVSYSAIALRYAVAVALQDLDSRRYTEGLALSGQESALAFSHFTRASSAFQEAMRQSAKPVDHVETLATFYFHYVYLTHQRAVNKEELQKLSQAVVGYLQRSSIGDVLARSTTESAAAMTPSMRSFLCRLLLWVYREDVYAMGYRCAGQVARYMSDRPKLLRRLCVVSRPALQLNWGTLYPTEQRLDDVFSAQHLDMLVRMIQLQFQITEFGWSAMSDECSGTPRPEARNAQIEEKLNLIETDFSPTFQMVTMPDDSHPNPACDLVESAAVFVTIYYAWKMIYYRCAGMPEDMIQEVLAMLMQAAQHTIRKVHLKDLRRALLAAVIETKNPIHKDWIMSKLGPRWRLVLEHALDRHSRLGKHVSIWTLYELASDTSGICVTQIADTDTERNAIAILNSESTVDAVVNAVDKELGALREINSVIHNNPELCFKEFKAHDNITALLESLGFAVEKHAYGLDTSFVAEYGQGGRLVTICSEYDALEGVGHACGHNLIATASIASFLGIAAALKQSGAPGRVRILGCPAEEGGGGKIKLIQAGAFNDVDAALMVHASTPLDIPQPDGAAAVGGRSVAIFRGIFTGEPAHAGVVPWNGINALDAASLTYSAISMLRQQIRPTDRLNLYIKEGGQMTNIITARSVVEVGVRTLTLGENEKLQERVRNCFKGAALATGCKIEFESVYVYSQPDIMTTLLTMNPLNRMDTYADLHSNEPLCHEFTDIMSRHFDSHFHGDMRDPHISGGGSDFGNVSYECPSLHPLFIIPTLPTDNVHAPGFTRAAGEPAAFDAAIKAAKGIAVLGVRVLADEEFAKRMREAYEEDMKKCN